MATTILTQHVLGVPFNGTTHNDNLQIIEDSLLDLGPYVISGLVPSAGAGLSVSVTAGVASIGGRVTVGSSFNIAGLTDAAVNHLYLLNTGAGASNTSGTQPANSVKLGTATTSGGAVTSVDTTPASGRQEKVDLTTVVTASDANLFTDTQTFRITDASGSAVSRPLILQHANSGGVGANGIGAGIHLQVETSTEGLFETAGQIDARTTSATAGAVSAVLDFKVPDVGVIATPLVIAAASLEIADGVNLFVGSTTGTKIATGTSQKLGFWNATPVAQQVLATGAGNDSDDIIAMLQLLGLCRQS